MDPQPPPPLQFSTGELLATVALTFAGMLIFKSLLSDMGEFQLLFIVVVSTWIAALSTMDGTFAHHRKLWRLVDRVLSVWLCIFLFCLLGKAREYHAVLYLSLCTLNLLFVIAVTINFCRQK